MSTRLAGVTAYGGLSLLLTGCSLFKNEQQKPPELAAPDTMYNNGVDALRTHRYGLAAAEFEALQQNYPYSGYTANSQLMEGYAYYLQDKYPEAAQQLDRFIELHPTSADSAYAFYLLALCYYEQIADVKRDQQLTLEAMGRLEDVIARFPQSKYARDAQLKIDLCRDHLAGKEMLVGRYYQQQHNYEGAVNRYQHVVQDYQTTNHVAEALERLVEVYLRLGLTDQARQTGAVLAYNYPGSKWYRYAYSNLKRYRLLGPNIPTPGTTVGAQPNTKAGSTETPAQSAARGVGRADAPPSLSTAPVGGVSAQTLPSADGMTPTGTVTPRRPTITRATVPGTSAQ
ncbi:MULTISPECIES: outer membrane protein assembly factor BamD [Acetobacter]|uniref:Outer membrane protein assembly factor BamD n=1 Tax=Acetobacter sacchari TaxID=2661687 RepID=A0ABS3LVB8_9PROT|nr:MULTISPECIES: outer membrane protein assembly factor BamD [Acetobacter]MBO1359858.1 outer membrane protein assembly factor BamD [Acetobacter sacchari]